eukprot:TRINITY_DN17157_c0_g1_i1.p1 TRINITY_DN17157_c0_g1~~TRINITY_DN17157_c0_g1_i1.p1  ORF type:complete len:223 (+),score=47.82 TRINITY_DN17157_c0_g1_i1:80-748(+)
MSITLVSYHKLTPAHVPKAIKCIGHSFATRNDPFTKALNLRAEQWEDMSGMFVKRAAQKDLSFVAINDTTGEIEGVQINEDWKELPPPDYKNLKDWKPVRAMFNELHTRYKAKSTYIEPGRIIHGLYFTCVRPESRKRGIVSTLWEKSTEVAQERNYAHMVAEGSNEVTGHLLGSKLGFKEIASVDFSSFLFEGKHPFDNLGSDGFRRLTIYQRPITSNLFI